MIKSRRMRWAGHRFKTRMVEIKNAHKILVGKPDEKST
jgi:hypothetical protein